MITIEELKEKIGSVIDPSRNHTLHDLNAIKHAGIDGDEKGVVLLIEVGKKNTDTTQVITRAIAKIVKLDLGFKSLVIDYEQARPKALTKTVKLIGVVSGKGGVGKSTVTANLAYALTSMGKKVGVIDADIYGANMPKIFECEVHELNGTPDQKLYPVEIDGIQMVSTEFLVEPDRALMWRGPMLGKVLKIFFEDTIWSQELDYLLIDLPPGTGDVMMDVKNMVPDAKMLVVTTPHPNASHIAIKAGFAAKSLNQDILGVLENMSYYEIDGVKHYIFGQGGGEIVADKLTVPFLGQIPIGQPSSGKHSIFAETERIGIIYLALAKRIMEEYLRAE
ncbi:MAG: P-loop NTPase [Bacilli bacterium]|nr:P-loop NTPase [Bacilli bacterium]MBN2696498.1 P-loop NTPase [Bacilli bacterium]